MRKLVSIIMLAVLIGSCSKHENWVDCNKNGVMDPYENIDNTINERVMDLISRMTLDEKISQMQAYSPCAGAADKPAALYAV